MVIEKDRVVSIRYTLKDDSGEVLDSSSSDSPLVYLHGNENIIPGLERELEGKETGASLKVTIKPADAYGEHSDKLIAEVPRSAFEGAGELSIGMQFHAQDEGGSHVVTITDIQGDSVTVDGNHPLAGVTLHFDVSVLDVREATDEEKAAGTIDSGCSCGCGDDCGDDEDCGGGCSGGCCG